MAALVVVERFCMRRQILMAAVFLVTYLKDFDSHPSIFFTFIILCMAFSVKLHC